LQAADEEAESNPRIEGRRFGMDSPLLPPIDFRVPPQGPPQPAVKQHASGSFNQARRGRET
jgi:hypothetical protein